MFRYRDPKPQVTKNWLDLKKISRNLHDYRGFETYLTLKSLLYKVIKTQENNMAEYGRHLC